MPTNIHFEYLPGAALAAAPGRVLGDVRLISAVAFVILGVFIVYLAWQTGDRRRVSGVMTLAVANPLTAAMFHWAWLDVYAVGGFAGWLALRRAHGRWALVCLTAALSVKPSVLPALAPLLLWSREARRDTLIAVAATPAIVLPFALITGPGAFLQDVFGFHAAAGFRFDGLTVSAWWYQATGNTIPFAVIAVIGAAAAVVALRRRPVDLSYALLAGALLTTVAFLLATRAFLTYYFVAVWVLMLSLGARGTALDGLRSAERPVPSRDTSGRGA